MFGTVDDLDKILAEKVNVDHSVARWRYVQKGLAMLKDLHSSVSTSGSSLGSNKQHQCVSQTVRAVLLMGAVPSFLPGVGMPADKRAQWGHLCKKTQNTGMEEV